jgi:hypothetical protein
MTSRTLLHSWFNSDCTNPDAAKRIGRSDSSEAIVGSLADWAFASLPGANSNMSHPPAGGARSN